MKNILTEIQRQRGKEAEFIPRPARRPTKARPGSDDKVMVLARRLENGESLYHPDDVVVEWPPPLRDEHGHRIGSMDIREAVWRINLEDA